MGRRRRKGNSGRDAVLGAVVITVIGVFSLIREGEWFLLTELLAVAVAVGGTWLLFFRSTRCGFTTRAEGACRLPAPGELRGCKKFHKGLKAEALLNHFGIPHPRQLMQRTWLRPADGAGEVTADEPAGELSRPVLDTVALIATVFSAVTSVLMPLIQMAIG